MILTQTQGIGKMNDLNPSQLEKFSKDGFVIVRNIFSKEECSHFKKILLEELDKGKDALKNSPKKSEGGTNSNKVADVPRTLDKGLFQDIAHRNAEFMSLAKDKRLTNILGNIYGEKEKAFYLYLSSSIFKNGEVTDGTQWHQDIPYWKGTDNKTIVWIALDKVTRENGCMKYIPGTHHKKYDHVNAEGHGGMYRKGFIDPDQVDESEKVLLELEIGDASFHNCRIVHGSEKNTLAKERYALVFVYQSEKDSSHHRDGPAELIPK